jgi:hypothetical protein
MPVRVIKRILRTTGRPPPCNLDGLLVDPYTGGGGGGAGTAGAAVGAVAGAGAV